MKQTAVEWLELSLLGIISFDSEELRAKYRNAITKAKEIENQESKQVGQITEKGIIDTIGNCGNCGVEFHIHKDIGEKQQGYSEEEVESFIIEAFNKGERYGWEYKDGIRNLEEMKYKIQLTSLEELIKQFKKK